MSRDIFTGVGYGFTLKGVPEELDEKIDELGYNFTAEYIDLEGTVLVGVELASQVSGYGDKVENFTPVSEGVVWALEELKSKMDIHSDIGYVFYYYTQY